jgi:anti-sigma B factor antagonist
MQIQSITKEGVRVVEVYEKRLVAKVAVDFKAKLLHEVNQGNNLLIIDLSKVEFIDSSGLGTIVSCLKAMGRSGEMIMCGVNDAVGQMFSLTRMDKVFDMYTTVDEAIQSLSN